MIDFYIKWYKIQVKGMSADPYIEGVRKRSQRKEGGTGLERWRLGDRIQEGSSNCRGGKCETVNVNIT